VAGVVSEGNNPSEKVMAWAMLLAVPSVLAFASLRLQRRDARCARVAAAALFAGFGDVTGLWLVLLPAAVLES
jgi:hypothetical protein